MPYENQHQRPVTLVDGTDPNQSVIGDSSNPIRVDPTGTTVQPVTWGGSVHADSGQVSVGATATLISAANPNRSTICITNMGTTDVYIGFTSGVTTSTGDLLAGTKGAFIAVDTQTDVYAIVATGSQTVSYSETTN